jgi:alanine racemase
MQHTLVLLRVPSHYPLRSRTNPTTVKELRMTRPSKALIDLAALRQNYLTAQTLHGGRALAVIKANAYGHGAVPCAHALADIADGFAVAFMAEALELRQAGITRPILILEGCFDTAELLAAHNHQIWFAVHQASQIDMIQASALAPASLHVWLKVDSGMHRAGFALDEVTQAYQRLASCSAVASITLMSHFARADEPNEDATASQIRAFEMATQDLPGERSLCNSAGVLAWPDARRDWARPGVLLYGASPLPAAFSAKHPEQKLLPVMTLQSEVFAVKTLQPGEALGYGGTFIAERPTRVGLVAIGYADGYPRGVPTGTPVAIDGKPSRIVGRVSMDMLNVDLTDLPEAGLGSRVELWGRCVDINEVAQRANTIAYELLCNVKRVPREYIDK